VNGPAILRIAKEFYLSIYSAHEKPILTMPRYQNLEMTREKNRLRFCLSLGTPDATRTQKRRAKVVQKIEKGAQGP